MNNSFGGKMKLLEKIGGLCSLMAKGMSSNAIVDRTTMPKGRKPSRRKSGGYGKGLMSHFDQQKKERKEK